MDGILANVLLVDPPKMKHNDRLTSHKTAVKKTVVKHTAKSHDYQASNIKHTVKALYQL